MRLMDKQRLVTSEFCTPRCLGFFDDRKDSETSENDFRFNLVYEKAEENVRPVSLYHLIREDSMPSLLDRIRLAHEPPPVSYIYTLSICCIKL